MALATKREKNVKKTGLKMTKKKAAQFKKSLRQKLSTDVEMVESVLEQMDTSEGTAALAKVKTDKSTKKRVLRTQRKKEMRSFVEQKSRKQKARAGDMVAEPEESQPQKPKVNEARLRKQDLPIVISAKTKAQKVNEGELRKSNVVSARRMSKKKARKVLQAQKRADKEKAEKAEQRARMEQ